MMIAAPGTSAADNLAAEMDAKVVISDVTPVNGSNDASANVANGHGEDAHEEADGEYDDERGDAAPGTGTSIFVAALSLRNTVMLRPELLRNMAHMNTLAH
jgi:hypothetical protein